MLKGFIWQPRNEKWMEDDEWMSKECSPRSFAVWSQQTNWTNLMIYDLTSKNLNASSVLSSFPPHSALCIITLHTANHYFSIIHIFILYINHSVSEQQERPLPPQVRAAGRYVTVLLDANSFDAVLNDTVSLDLTRNRNLLLKKIFCLQLPDIKPSSERKWTEQ